MKITLAYILEVTCKVKVQRTILRLLISKRKIFNEYRQPKERWNRWAVVRDERTLQYLST